MRLLVYVLAALTPALGVPDPIVACQADHPDDLAAYAGCLEAALRAGECASAEAEPVDAEPSGLGAEQIPDEREDDRDEASIVIIGTTYDSAGLGTFRTESGQVWRETSPSPKRRHLDGDRRYEARIVRGKIGGYRMHVEGVRWMKTVRRIK